MSETYPSGRTIATGYDGANQPAWLQGTFGTTVTLYIGNANSGNWIQYWPSGEPYAFLPGNNLEHVASLNGRLQVVESYEAVGNQNTVTNMLSCPGWGFSNNSKASTTSVRRARRRRKQPPTTATRLPMTNTWAATAAIFRQGWRVERTWSI